MTTMSKAPRPNLGKPLDLDRQVYERVHLNPEEVDKAFQHRLEELTANCHEERGQLIEHYDDHPHNGDAMYRPFQGTHIEAQIILAALRLQEALRSGK
jgi:hypothetical protein